MSDGSDGVSCDGSEPNTIGLTRNVGVPFEEIPFQISKFSEPTGNGSPELRLQEQDKDGVDAEVMFTWADGLFRNAKDDGLYLALVHAYNDYLAEEYASVAPDRLIPLGTIPTTGLEDAMAELEHCSELGFKGVNLNQLPSGHGYPTPEDDRFWQASLDLRIAISVHGGGRFGGFGGGALGKGGRDPLFNYPRILESPQNHKADALPLLFANQGSSNGMAVMQLAYAGVWDRFPDLRLYCAETMVGWLPFALFMLDDNYRRYQPMMRHFWGLNDLERKPSEYMKDHSLWGTLYDPFGVQVRDAIGTENIMFATDFPHAAGDWPNSWGIIDDMFQGVPKDDTHAMLAGNAAKFWHLDS
jgi:predicted TIM-barrel fold metal-dependent hydrolase